MAVTIQNYRIIPYAQKDALPKVIFGGTWGIEITLPTAHESGDGYILALDYERIVYPLARPVCAYSNDFALDGDALSMSVSLDTLRLAKWVSSIRKPTPICVQIVRVRGDAYETILLDEMLALPSVTNGDAYADPHSPIMDTLAEYVGDGATTIRQGGVTKGVITANQKTDNVIDLDAGGGGGSVEQATDAEIDEREAQDASITPYRLNYAVTAALTDANHITLTAEQQATAQEVLGVPAPIIGTTAPTTATVGKLMQPYLNSTTGKTYHCTAITNTGTEAEPVWEYTWREDIEDVQVNGSSIVSDGVANLRKATGKSNELGVVAVNAGSTGLYSGLKIDNNGNISLSRTTDQYIDSYKDKDFGSPIVLKNLSYAVRSVSPNITTIPAATSTYALLDATATTNNHSWQYQHAPTAASTYTLPQVSADSIKFGSVWYARQPSSDDASSYAWSISGTIRYTASSFPRVNDVVYSNAALTNEVGTVADVMSVSHRIKLTIDFTAVQTYAFEDSQGAAITPLFTPTISAGDVYEFDCEWSAVKAQWLIWPHKQGSVSDDYVMQSEVGAANGVAGLDANGKVSVAELPVATSTLGAVKIAAAYGITANQGELHVNATTDSLIDDRTNAYRPIVPTNLNYSVTAALTDANHITLTAEQQATAQAVLGVPTPIIGTTAPTTSTVGAVGQLYVDTVTSKTYHCTAVTTSGDPEVTTYTWQEDLPHASSSVWGAVLVNPNSGLAVSVYTGLGLNVPSGSQIDNRQNSPKAITVPKLDYAVRSVLPNITEIPAATTAYTLLDAGATTNSHSYCYEHAPESAPTYTLPAVTGNAVKREIILTVRFSSSVLTYAFEDSAGNAITPLPLAGTIADGSVVCFRCTWEALLGQWVIMPVMLGTYVAPEP